MGSAKTTTARNEGGAGVTVETEPEPSRFSTVTPWLSLVVRLGLAVMWLVYSLPKVTDISANRASVAQFRILSGGLATFFAYAQPYLELSLALLLLLGLGIRIIAGISGLLLLVYIAGIISLAPRGINITCGCGGGGSFVAAGHTHYILDVLRDLGYLLPAIWLLIWSHSRFSLDRWLLPAEPVPAPLSAASNGKRAGQGSASAKRR